MNVDDTVDKAIDSLHLGDRVRRVVGEEADAALKSTACKFVEDSSCRWWWESLVEDKPTATFHAQSEGFRLIPRVCPDEPSWFVVTNDCRSDWTVYEAVPDDVASILGECHAFEYFVASRDSQWIVFENHHDMIIGMGAEVTGPICELSQ